MNIFSKKNKYFAKREIIDNISFDSKLEADYYHYLILCQKAGEIKYFIRQPKFDVGGGVTYSADYLVFNNDGTHEIIDVKGRTTGSAYDNFLRKKKIVEALYPIEIKVVT